jgi:16S rRNA (adenine(1408)-N(1))-methyltransferase
LLFDASTQKNWRWRMESMCGKRSLYIGADTLLDRVAGASTVLVDIGTGDGRYVLHAARASSSCFAIGVDACREQLRVASRTAPRNALFAIAEARALPYELFGLATQVTINFPWGSLLGGLLDGDAGLLEGMAAIGQPNPEAGRCAATLEIRLNGGALAEAGWSLEAGAERVRQALAAHGFSVGRPAPLDARALRACPTTWAKRLAFGRDPRALYLRAIVPVPERAYELAPPNAVAVS